MLTKRPIETSGARCEHPRRLSRRRVNALQASKFRCKGNQTTCRRDDDRTRFRLGGFRDEGRRQVPDRLQLSSCLLLPRNHRRLQVFLRYK